MKALVYNEYGPPEVLHIEEVDTPTPKKNELLISVKAASVNYGDLLARNFKGIPLSKFNMPFPFYFPVKIVFGINTPKMRILGSEFSGIVEKVGEKTTRFKTGDEVFGYSGMNMGAYAACLCTPENGCVAQKPSRLSFEEAAVIPYGALMASGILKKVEIKKGAKVLVNGASGGIGSAAVQLFKNLYGAKVTGVCSTPRVEYVKNLGADSVIDYTKEDFTKRDETYDIILDIYGRLKFGRCKKNLTENGVYLLASFKTGQLFQMLWTRFFGKKKVVCAFGGETQNDLLHVKEMIEQGKIQSIVDQSFSFEDAALAHQYVEQGHKKGNVVLTIEHK